MATMKDLEKLAMAKVRDILVKEIAPIIEKDMIDEYKWGYKQYNPIEYGRSYEVGGMIDPGNIETESTNNGFTMKNITVHDGRNIAEIWEHGGESWSPYGKPGDSWTEPRPVIKRLRERLISSQKIQKLLREKLKDSGYTVS